MSRCRSSLGGACLASSILLLGCRDEPPPPAAGTGTTGATGTTGSSTAVVDGTTAGGSDVLPDLPGSPPVCDDYDPARTVLWGDLHVHTAFSFDAWLHDVRVDPDQAYRFARGEPVQLPPLDMRGNPTQTVQIDRPLDFAAITDHAEFLAEVQACTDPSTVVYDTTLCIDYRANQNGALVTFALQLGMASPVRFPEICGPGGIDCPALAAEVWQRTIEAAEAHYVGGPSCEFTSFVGYEWSGMQSLSNLHRNVIFRGAQVPARPLSHYEAPSAQALWDALQTECLDAPGCDVLAIPHNSNWSNGRLFQVEYPGRGSDAEQAAQRAAMEPLVEVFQHKGDSECMNGLSGVLGEPDELCEFEKLRVAPFDDCGDGIGSNGMVGGGCVSRRDFLRGALLEGLREQERIGVNPFALGFIASTDTHNGTPGMVDEDGYVGHVGREEGDALARLTGEVPAGPRNGPGGLVAVWATENSRDAIFEALRRRETYGTSGPRITVRVFGGAELPEDMCSRGDFVAVGDAHGVPMGGELSPGAGAGAPRFAVSALRDPMGLPLQRAQIVKGWIDDMGMAHVVVHDVAGGDNGATVDPTTCVPQGDGADSLCSVWSDPDFDPSRPAYYYVRVVENPRCRWSTTDCQSLGDMAPAICDELPTTIQERAWTSPIWYSP
ncbi:MAG: DUF3604 domain-containing protein [Myxococcales bacterium]|nr:DUF3604 domain-containing protein [Myxococcales bacterium]